MNANSPLPSGPGISDLMSKPPPPLRSMESIKERECVEPESAAAKKPLNKSPPADRPPCATIPLKAAPSSRPKTLSDIGEWT
eukprot:2380386-Prorocentrum_lima.AAC.1